MPGRSVGRRARIACVAVTAACMGNSTPGPLATAWPTGTDGGMGGTGSIAVGVEHECTTESVAPPACVNPENSSPRAPQGLPCLRHEDCAAEEFCGAGYCLVPEDASFTVCAEAAHVQGGVPTLEGGDPVLRFYLGDRQREDASDSYTLYYPGSPGCKWPTACLTAVAAGCAVDWDTCNTYDYRLLASRDLPVNTWVVLEESAASPGVPLVSGSFDGVTLGRYVDQGCVELAPDLPPEDVTPSYAVRTWISVWYNLP